MTAQSGTVKKPRILKEQSKTSRRAGDVEICKTDKTVGFILKLFFVRSEIFVKIYVGATYNFLCHSRPDQPGAFRTW